GRAGEDVARRTIGDGHDLTAPRFHGNRQLEAAYDDEITLKQGRTGTAIRILQQALVDLGYVLPRFGVDGDFGDETEAAVRAFQVDTGAQVDGLVGPETMGHLDARVQGQHVAPTPAVAVGAALPAPRVIVAPGAPPSNGLGACTWGLTFPENVDIDMQAVRNGPNWVPVVTGLVGNYSLQARLLPGSQEVTGPGGNTTAANYCAQVRDLANPHCPGMAWDMIRATVEHERVHARFFRAALVNRAAAIEARVEALSVPHAAGMTAASAATALRALPGFAAARTNAQQVWLAQILATGAHGVGTINADTRAAERTIYDPMIRRICNFARGRAGFAPCSPPC
ncbi:MAG: peptidoglycan-binding protein, partial [Gammaproteobacteria bacterium]|nr:peptidoglycan-binding protein [Gammaproteobacteria bacterium]